MPEFQVHLPRTAEEAVSLRVRLPDSMYVAGGTDLLPNLKHGLAHPQHLVSLSQLGDFAGISFDDTNHLVIGAGTTLQVLAEDSVVRSALPSLAQAAGLVAGPQHRRMGTIGGNVMLDTRCLYYNQSEAWRNALGYCLKAEGDWCHVIGSKATCVAANSADTVPVLLAAQATLHYIDADGPQVLPIVDLYQQNGMDNHSIPKTALLTEIRVPRPATGHRSVYRKVRARNAIDFPQLGLAAHAQFQGETCTSLALWVSAIMPKPKQIKRLDPALQSNLSDDTIDTIAEQVYKQVRPQTSIQGEPAWRRHMARVETKRALIQLRDDPSTRAGSPA